MDFLLFSLALYAGFHLLIMYHEFGHYLAAKAVGAPVIEVCSGIGPTLFRLQLKNETIRFRLLPIAGYVTLVGANWFPMKPKDIREIKNKLVELNPEHPGLRRDNWFRRKSVFARVFVTLAGPVASVMLAAILIPAAVYFFGPIPTFNPFAVPQDTRCAAAVVCEIELNERGIEDGMVTLSYGGEDHTYEVKMLRRWNPDTRLVEARNHLREYWDADPTGLVLLRHDDNPAIPFYFKEVIEKHLERFNKDGREEDEKLLNASLGQQAMVSMGRFFNLMSSNHQERSLANGVWRKTLIGHLIDRGQLYWVGGLTGFIYYVAWLSAVTGILNLAPVYPLDGGQIVREVLISMGCVGKKVMRFAHPFMIVSVLLVLLATFLLPLVLDAIVLIQSLFE